MPVLAGPDGIVDGRLGCERQSVHPVVSKIGEVRGNPVRIAGEHHIELPRCGKEVIVMRRVFFVPEDRGDPVIAAPFHEGQELRFGP